MKNVISGIVAAGVVVLLAFFFMHTQTVSAPTPDTDIASSTTQTSSSKPTFKIGTPTAAKATASFDSEKFTSNTIYPVITGKANVPKVGLIIYNGKGVGVSGTSDITVVGGRWSYTASVALKPDTYTLVLIGGDTSANATLNVTL